MNDPGAPTIDVPAAARLLARWGFQAQPDLPDRPGDAWLIVALRDAPTLDHFDPEVVHFWVSHDGRGQRAVVDRSTPMPLDLDFSWGLIRIVDRLGISNEYLTFGGRLRADTVEGARILVFDSPAPLLRRGGHSQVWDRGADCLAGFFARLLVTVDYGPGFEARAAAASPVARYAAFVLDTAARYRRSPALRAQDLPLWALLSAEERRLRAAEPGACLVAEGLLAAVESAARAGRSGPPVAVPA